MSRYHNLTLTEKLQAIPKLLLVLIVTVSIIGFVMMYTAGGGNLEPWGNKQIVRFVVLLILMIFIAITDIKIWLRYSYLFYALAVGMLLAVELSGATVMGAQRWLRVGSFSIQPSEIMKLALVFALARYFNGLPGPEIEKNIPLLPALGIIGLPTLLVAHQPDLGTAMILLMVGIIVFFAAGVQIWKFLVVGSLGLASLPLVWFNLYDYQRQRIHTFLNPNEDPLGSGYNVLQSMIAIGSGGATGKGLLKGTQSQLSFLPEKQTDFIFTMLNEEFGFIGGVTILLLFLTITIYCLMIIVQCSNHYGRLLGTGVVAMIFLHVLINTAMVMGLLPIVGVPLPLVSYGGTIMAVTLLGLGFIMNVHIHRTTNLEGFRGLI